MLPRYPIYIPSKGRAAWSHTARFLKNDGVPFLVVVEEPEREEYAKALGEDSLLVLPFVDQGLIAARNWIKQHSIEQGSVRHWQLDDNIRNIRRLYKGKRIPCAAGPALAAAEDFADRYENLAIVGLNYKMFAVPGEPQPPFYLNGHVYSCSLILNAIPHRWRLRYNDDTDLCLQVLADGWCTALINVFLIEKIWTMVVPGGNTEDLYRGDGRLKMARALERVWPGVVYTARRFSRPQHRIKYEWKRFDNKLIRRPDVVVPDGPNEYGLRLGAVQPVKARELREWLEALPNEEPEEPSS